MIATVIVVGTAALAVAFLVAWLVRPDLRASIERPKHGFHANVRAYDQSRHAEVQAGRRAE
jgi:hypothetical protein